MTGPADAHADLSEERASQASGTECRHGMTPEFADCTGRDGGERDGFDRLKRLLDHYGWIPARFPGRCAACGEPYRPGEPIALDARPGGADGWVASCCDEEDT